MGLIKRADIESYTRDACVMDLSDLRVRGDALVKAANDKATQIIREAQKERERLVATAKDEGHKQGYELGYAEGLSKGHEEGAAQARADHAEVFQQLITIWSDQLGAFEQQRDEMLEGARVQLIELAAMIASRVVRRVIELDPGTVLRQLESVLSTVTEPTRLVISVHPDDAQLVKDELPMLVERFASCEHAQITTDPMLTPGSCVARTPSGGVIDSSIDTQLQRIVDSLVPNGHQARLEIERGEVQDEDDQDAQGDAA
ncbi:MAG: hypothetical protein KDA29_05700 [Phycisphaerales bacterium]|nr:hypothetical protein [Phycisphaerales bacterium]